MKAITTDDGAQLHVAVRGHGSPVVLLHSWGADHTSWGKIATELAHHHTVYAWDARGHGKSAGAGGALPVVARMASDLRLIIEHFHLDKPTVVAHSMGVLIVWEMIAGSGCGNLGRICLIDQSPRLMTDESWRWGIYGDWPAQRNLAFLASLRANFPEAILKLMADGHNAAARHQVEHNGRGIQKLRESLARLDPEQMAACWDSLTRADYRNVLPTITVPALLIYGGASNYYDEATARHVAGLIPGAALHIFPGADHSPHLADRERFLALLEDFMAGSPGPAAP